MHSGRTETRARLLIAGCFLLAYLTLLLLAAAYLRRCPCEQAFQALESSDPQTRAYGIGLWNAIPALRLGIRLPFNSSSTAAIGCLMSNAKSLQEF